MGDRIRESCVKCDLKRVLPLFRSFLVAILNFFAPEGLGTIKRETTVYITCRRARNCLSLSTLIRIESELTQNGPNVNTQVS